MPAKADLRLCVVSDGDATLRLVAEACCPPFTCVHRDLAGATPELDEGGAWFDELAAAARTADAVVVAWDTLQAPLIGALARCLRGTHTPLVALCAAAEVDHVAALSVGADVVHPLPLSAPLLKAQVVAHRRHAPRADAPAGADRSALPARGARTPAFRVHEPRPHRTLEAGPLVIDLSAFTARVGAEPVQLTPLQLQVLALLVEHAGSVLSRDEFLNRIWGFDFETGTNVVDVHMHYIRRALRKRGFDGAVTTVRGVGYRLDVPEAVALAA